MSERRNNIVRGDSAGGDPNTTVGGPDVIRNIVRVFMGTDEFLSILEAAVPEAAALWTGKSRTRKILAAPFVRSIEKSISRKKNTGNGSGFSSLLKDPEFIPAVSQQLPAMANGVMDFLAGVLADIAMRPVDEQSEILRKIFSGLDAEKAGKLLTGLGCIINTVHEKHPEFFAETLRNAVKGIIAGIDFGELKELVDGSGEDITAVVSMIHEELWQYPAKVVCLFSLVPAALNFIVSSAAATIAPMNKLAPDILADVMLSLAEDVEGEEIGKLINEVSELVRKVHTGSALIGDQGRPKLPESCSALAEHVINAVDPELFMKAWRCIDDISGQLERKHLLYFLENNPQLARRKYCEENSARQAVRLCGNGTGKWTALKQFFPMMKFPENWQREWRNLTRSNLPIP